MKVFISWSGDSKGVAQAVFDALPTLFDNAAPWISTANRSGAIWLVEIEKQLNDTDFGIVVVSKRNQAAKWLNFEAGALSRKVGAQRELMPVLLLDFDSTGDIEGPLTGFHMKMATLEGFFDIMKDLNASDLGPKIKEDILRRRVEVAWPAIADEVQKVKSAAVAPEVDKRDEDEKLDEILNTVRSIASSTASASEQSRRAGVNIPHRPKSLVAKAISEAGRAGNVGAMSISFTEENKALVETERPVDDVLAARIHAAAKEALGQDLEISYEAMPPHEAEHLRSLTPPD